MIVNDIYIHITYTILCVFSSNYTINVDTIFASGLATKVYSHSYLTTNYKFMETKLIILNSYMYEICRLNPIYFGGEHLY